MRWGKLALLVAMAVASAALGVNALANVQGTALTITYGDGSTQAVGINISSTLHPPKQATFSQHTVTIGNGSNRATVILSPESITTTSSSTTSTSSSMTSTSSSSSSTTTSTTTTGSLVFSDDFTNGLGQWFPQACLNETPPNGLTVVTSPERAPGEPSVRFTVADSSTHANCAAVPTADARAQIVGPKLFANGSDDFIAWSEMFPAGMPLPPSWFQFAEIYGPPFGGSPSMGFDLGSNGRMSLDRDSTHGYDSAWVQSSPIVAGHWYDITVHVKFSTDRSVGFVELWLDGQPQTLTNGQTRLYYDTLVPGVNWDGSTPDDLTLNQYRDHNATMGAQSIYASQVRVGTSYAVVQPPVRPS